MPAEPTGDEIAGHPLQRVQLTTRYQLWQCADGHRSATDDTLCAWAGWKAAPDAGRILDLGAGQGSVTLLLAGRIPGARLMAVEVQEISHRLLVRNITDNGLDGRIEPVHGDLRHVALEAAFDLVTGSPPYMAPGAGTLPANEQRAAARFELRGGIEEYCHAASRALTADGAAVFLMNGDQDSRCRAAIAGAGLQLARRWRILRGHPVARFLIYELRRGPVADPPTVDLEIRLADGSLSDAYRGIRADLDLPGW